MRLYHLPALSLLAAACTPATSVSAPEDRAPVVTTSGPSALTPEAPPAGTVVEPASHAPVTNRVMFNFSDATLLDLVRAVGEVTGKRFILSGNLPAIKATLYSPDPITADEAYRAFLTVLAENGLTVVPRGGFLVIVLSPGLGKRP